MNINLLSLVLLTPLFGALFTVLFGRDHNEISARNLKTLGFIICLGNSIVSGILAYNYNIADTSYQFVITGNNGENLFGIDGISLSLILLTTILTPICFIASKSITQNVKFYVTSFLLLEFIVIGVFSSLNLLLFYIFFEMSLIPMFFIIGLWGGENKIYASFKFFLYTLAGSVLFLVAIIYIYQTFHTFDIQALTTLCANLDLNIQKYLWLAMFASFAVKIPMLPFHTWLPDAHVQAPTVGSVMLAGILLKLGGYGFIRFSLPMLPLASMYFADLVSVLSIIAIIYGSIVAFAQKDMKKMIAYSSIAHMGYVTIGLFSGTNIGVTGAIFQMISHGLISAALFLVVGSLYDRTHTKEISAYGGVAEKMPSLAFYFMIFTLASVALPGTSGFVGELLIIIGSFKQNTIFGTLIASGVILGATYMLYLYARIMFGEVTHKKVMILQDLTLREHVYFLPLAVLIILLGIYPSLITELFDVRDLISSTNIINIVPGVEN
ncbi:NADH-quinone oxidoreductase subunit M [Rickettsiales endosymbiont of Stachyamoeba lipophora]|uniref:NADH-quinone oxidoreductase subunit M n=1 Tax=Rickettsiales endosymbiont of Stachyamoeba lipophora TaxID=2486578 RepID=UPI000F64951C|nr:NADH-quinone oxidoreductase subunit M [Rickettsiales endosymbiont of Stachyamoeba lipophora]AZL15996.1 NADH-quinone oxidoreductase subunit M [Rickettsiales endosymbiont of Stachyamoeba lipophora]